jgi:hypothetical protein
MYDSGNGFVEIDAFPINYNPLRILEAAQIHSYEMGKGNTPQAA